MPWVCNILFVTCYIGPEGPRQRLHYCPRANGGDYTYFPQSYPRPAPPAATHGLPKICQKSRQKKRTKEIDKGKIQPRVARTHPFLHQLPDLPLPRAIASPSSPHHLPDLCIPQEGQDRRGCSVVPKEQPGDRCSRVLPLACLPGAPPQLLDLNRPCLATDKRVMA